jgi:hypothetical protein
MFISCILKNPFSPIKLFGKIDSTLALAQLGSNPKSNKYKPRRKDGISKIHPITLYLLGNKIDCIIVLKFIQM